MSEEKQRRTHLTRALALACESAREGGGPFGALVVQDDTVLAEGSNHVVCAHDPTAHAEMTAIRNAAEVRVTPDLTRCTLYTSSYPCSMCLSAAWWANIQEIYYANTVAVATEAGFRDESFYERLCTHGTQSLGEYAPVWIDIPDAAHPFRIWRDNPRAVHY